MCSAFSQSLRVGTKSALRLTGGIVGLLVLGLGAMPMPTLAIPEADAIKKLEVVAVYVLLTEEGRPAFSVYSESPDRFVLPMYMNSEQALQAQEELEEISGIEGSRVISIPLNTAFERNEKLLAEIKAQDESKSLITPLVPDRVDWKKAEEILLAQGISPEKIAQSLQVPVFFTEPPISITLPGTEEAKFALFFNYSQLQEFKQAIPDFEGEEKVLDLLRVMELVMGNEEDRYLFLPTEDMAKIIQAQQQQQSELSQEEQESDQ